MSTLDVSQYLHTSWTAQEGYFPGAGITNNGIAQTADGYVWVLASTGLFRFDGVRFVEWKPPPGDSLPGAPPSQLLAASDGSLWIGGRGVARLDSDGSYHRYKELENLNHIRFIEDRKHVIWVGAETAPQPGASALYRVDHGHPSAYTDPALQGRGVFPFYVDTQGQLWAGNNEGIWRLTDHGAKLAIKKSTPNPVFSEAETGGLLYVDAGRIRRLTGDGHAEDYLGSLQPATLNVRTMLRDREGGLWIGTMGRGIVHLHSGRIDNFTSSDGLFSNSVESLFEDREGNIWATTPESIEKFTKPAVAKITMKQGLSADAIYSVLVDRGGRAWVGTADGFNQLDGTAVSRPEPQIANDVARAVTESRTGRLIMTTQARDESLVSPTHHLVPGIGGGSWLQGYGNVFWFAQDRAGSLWAVSQQRGLLHFGEDGSLLESFRDPGWNDFALSLAYDATRDAIWFTLHDGHLFLYKDGRILESYGRSDGLAAGPLRVLSVDRSGGVWLAASDGLSHLMSGKISTLGRRNGLPCDHVHWMERDQQHGVWLYTACGLVGLSDRELAAWTAKPSRSVILTHHLDNTEGVENSSVGGWYSPQTAATGDGRILFAMRTGLGVLDPGHLNDNLLPPPVHVESLTVDSHEYSLTRETRLPARPGSIHITYTALSFAAPRKVRFRYMLQGYDKDWSEPVLSREVTYTNLPPGRYSFHVIGCNNDGVWNQKGATLGFSVAPSWYQTLWARSLFLLLLLSILSAFYQRRVLLIKREANLRYEERIAERMRIARELHDTLLQALQGLLLTFSHFSSQVTATPELRADMDGSLDRAEQLVISGRERIRDLRQGASRTRDLSRVLLELLEDTFRATDTETKLTFRGTPRPLNEAVQEEAVWILREALSNARQHSLSSRVVVEVAFLDREFRISVQDQGRGFDQDRAPAAADGHYGVAGMRERAESVGGSLRIDSSPGVGTTVSFTLPAMVAHQLRHGVLSKLRAMLKRT